MDRLKAIELVRRGGVSRGAQAVPLAATLQSDFPYTSDTYQLLRIVFASNCLFISIAAPLLNPMDTLRKSQVPPALPHSPPLRKRE